MYKFDLFFNFSQHYSTIKKKFKCPEFQTSEYVKLRAHRLTNKVMQCCHVLSSILCQTDNHSYFLIIISKRASKSF